MKSEKFITIYILATSHLFYGYFFTNIYKNYGKTYINDDNFLSWVGAISSLFNGCFKLFWATMLDYYSFRRIYGGLISLMLCLIILINYAVYNKWCFFIVSCLTYMCDGSLTSMLPAVTVGQFGITRGPQVYGYMYSCFGVSSFLNVFLVSYVKPIVDFKGMFIISFFFSTIAASLTYTFREHDRFNYLEAY